MQGILNGGAPYEQQTYRGETPWLPMGNDIRDSKEYLPIVIPTVLNAARDQLNIWNSISVFYNKWWYPEPDVVTLPFCFFHEVKHQDKQKIDVSKKRVIMYEPPTTVDDSDLRRKIDPVRKGLMQTIIDNTVVNPVEYQLEVIVPYMPFGRYVRQNIYVMRSVIQTIQPSEDYIAPSAQQYMLSALNMAYNKYSAYAKALGTLDAESSVGTGSLPQDEYKMYNKDSLDAMVATGNIVQYKTWMGDKSKYVLITDKTAEKRNNEDDVWRVTLTVQEVPVLSMRRYKGSIGEFRRPWVIGATDTLGKAAFDTDRMGQNLPANKIVAVSEGVTSGT